MKKKTINGVEYQEGSGNVFADLGLSNSEESLAKSKIVMKIHDIIKKKLTQAAKILKISQPKISLLLRGYLEDFSLERLLCFLNDLGQDVYISIVASHSGHGSNYDRRFPF